MFWCCRFLMPVSTRSLHPRVVDSREMHLHCPTLAAFFQRGIKFTRAVLVAGFHGPVLVRAVLLLPSPTCLPKVAVVGTAARSILKGKRTVVNLKPDVVSVVVGGAIAVRRATIEGRRVFLGVAVARGRQNIRHRVWRDHRGRPRQRSHERYVGTGTGVQKGRAANNEDRSNRCKQRYRMIGKRQGQLLSTIAHPSPYLP